MLLLFALSLYSLVIFQVSFDGTFNIQAGLFLYQEMVK